MPLMILITVTCGIATASESAAIAVLYALVLGAFVYKELKVSHIIQALKKTAIMTASIMIIGGFTMIFTWVLAIEQIPNQLANFIISSNIPWWIVFILFDLLILFLGTCVSKINKK